jgi:hypothetical protein
MSETMVSNGGNLSSDEWKDFDFSSVKVEKPRATRALPRREILRFIVVGLFSGAMVWLVRLAFESWVMGPLFCRTPDTASVCANASPISFTVALVVVGVIMSAILASQRVFRAVVITAATFTCLGALWPLLNLRDTVSATALMAVFATGFYLFFALIAAVKRYALAIILTAALTVAFWLLARS